jgi:hypothetical protein
MSVWMSWLGVLAALQAQDPDGGGRASVVERLKALSFLVGEWEGTGSMTMGPNQKYECKIKESVQFRLSGNAILIEGLGTAKVGEGGTEQVVHEAIALITWSPREQKYIMHAMTARMGHVAPTLEVGDKKLVWGFDNGAGGKIRYTITIDDQGQWVEVGEFSMDGRNWTPFMDMKLARK